MEGRKIAISPLWSEPIEIIKIEEKGEFIYLIGKLINSSKLIDQVLTREQYQSLTFQNLTLDFSANPSEAFLGIEALRFKYASLFDPLLAMNVSKIDPLPFQIEAVYGYILKLPKIRFLIADDPGAGKTIMAGLVIKELKLRRLANRILTIVPGHLKDQWRRELKEKFQETFIYIDRSTFDNSYGENPWLKENQVITSMDFAKQDDILNTLSNIPWDLVIVDEAHKLSAYRYGEKVTKTSRYKLGEVLSKNSNHLLFLTATPHKGDKENYRLFLDLLIPGFFAKAEMIQESIENKDNPLFIRRLKEDLTDFEGKRIFTNRYSKTIKFRLSDEEKRLYNTLSKYVIFQYNKALELENNRKRNIAFALVILQRRMASSVYALLKSLERRKNRLEEILKGPEIPKLKPSEVDIEEVEDLEEEKRWEKEKEWESLTLAKNKEELKKEIETIEELIKKAREILEKEEEVKLKELKKAVEEGFRKIKETGGQEKILIFTESRDTMEYLSHKLSSWGYSVVNIHGGMKLEDRIRAEGDFKNEKQIMVATEAAGEGINLQFCNIMINYDIPWNPNRLEQRMGRIHRYGQQKDVYIFNLVTEDTREGEVLAKLLDKLEEIRSSLGTDRVFDIIGDIFSDKNLYQLIVDAVVNAKNLDDIIKEIDIKIDENYINKIKEALGESLATRYIDYTRIKEMTEKAKENRLVPEYVEEFFKRALEKAGGKTRKLKESGFIAVDSIPSEIKRIAEDVNFKNKYGIMRSSYPKVTFDKETAFKHPEAEFISFGHPLMEALIEWCIRNYSQNLQKGAIFRDPSGKYNGLILFFEGEITDGKEEIVGRRIFSLYKPKNGEDFIEINPVIIWDLKPKEDNLPLSENLIEILEIKEKAENQVLNLIENYRKELLEERERQAEIKRKYGIRSLKEIIIELNSEIMEYEKRKNRGEDVNIVIINKELRKKEYEFALKELEEEIDKETNLKISMPKFLGAILVLPLESQEMVSDEGIEKIGMKIAMEYEISCGRKPEDVSKENLGFDIRSKGEKEIRYIEVKARKDFGPIALTPNEWIKAQRFKEDYYLYIVCNAITNPELYIIKNPSEKITPEEKLEVVRYIVPKEEWKEKSEKVL